ncbi:MAG: Gfo/Idh/MocA family oxidoreductase, partial [Prevotellaceae bacterium]|nr:Gfo/Idh/MocA family oxidoreductase [Prevotellaceae bacterium]
FYEDLLDRKDIDAVSVAVPDHWHALVAVHALQSGKDVYLQKPMTYTITEGLTLVKTVRNNGRVLQVGSQQRSGKEFQQAIALVRSGAVGHIETIFVKVGDPPRPFDLPEVPIPATLNWNKWMGPLTDPKIHYHPDICPVITLEPERREQLWGAWRWYRETGNGYTADWGAHMFDIAQAAIGMDGSGPCEFIPKGYNGAKYLTMKYQNGIVMTEQEYRKEGGLGISFNGTKGWLKVAREYIECSDPELLKKEEQKVGEGQYEVSSPHMQNFVDCIRSRKNPIAPVEVGCSTNTLCCIANIATELSRPVKWDPATLSFGDDKEATEHRLYRYEYRRPYSL